MGSSRAMPGDVLTLFTECVERGQIPSSPGWEGVHLEDGNDSKEIKGFLQGSTDTMYAR